MRGEQRVLRGRDYGINLYGERGEEEERRKRGSRGRGVREDRVDRGE